MWNYNFKKAWFSYKCKDLFNSFNEWTNKIQKVVQMTFEKPYTYISYVYILCIFIYAYYICHTHM